MGKFYEIYSGNSKSSVYNPFLFDTASKFAEFGGKIYKKSNANFSLNACYKEGSTMNVVCVSPSQDGVKFKVGTTEASGGTIGSFKVFGKTWYYWGGILGAANTSSITYGNLLNDASFMNKTSISLAGAAAYLATNHAIKYIAYNSKDVIKLMDSESGYLFQTPAVITYTRGSLNTNVSSITCKVQDGATISDGGKLIKGSKVYFQPIADIGYYINTEYGNNYNSATNATIVTNDFGSSLGNIYAAYSCDITTDSFVKDFSYSYTKQDGTTKNESNLTGFTDSPKSLTNVPAGNQITITANPKDKVAKKQYSNATTYSSELIDDCPSGYAEACTVDRFHKITGGTGTFESGTGSISITGGEDKSKDEITGYKTYKIKISLEDTNYSNYLGNSYVDNRRVWNNVDIQWDQSYSDDYKGLPDYSWTGRIPYQGATVMDGHPHYFSDDAAIYAYSSGYTEFESKGSGFLIPPGCKVRAILAGNGITTQTTEFGVNEEGSSTRHKFNLEAQGLDNTTYTGTIQASVYSHSTTYSAKDGSKNITVLYNNSTNKPTNCPAGDLNIIIKGLKSTHQESWGSWQNVYSCNATTCLTDHTRITLANGSKKMVSELKDTDLLKVYSFATGRYEIQYPLFIYKGKKENSFMRVYLEDNSYIDICGEHHDIYDPVASKFIEFGKKGIHKASKLHPNYVFKDGKNVKIIKFRTIKKSVYAYSIASAGTLTVIADDVLVGFGHISERIKIINNKWEDKIVSKIESAWDSKKLNNITKDIMSNKILMGMKENLASLFTTDYDALLNFFKRSTQDELRFLDSYLFDTNKKYFVTLINDDKSNIEYDCTENKSIILPHLEGKKRWYHVGEYKYFNPGDMVDLDYNSVFIAI